MVCAWERLAIFSLYEFSSPGAQSPFEVVGLFETFLACKATSLVALSSTASVKDRWESWVEFPRLIERNMYRAGKMSLVIIFGASHIDQDRSAPFV
jgi:hypothetical protein